MRLLIILCVLSLAPFARAQVFGSSVALEHRNTLTIQSNGVCQIRTETLETRKAIEEQIRFWEAYLARAESDNAAIKPPAQTNALSDADIATKLREISKKRVEVQPRSPAEKIERIEVTSNTVRVVITRPFDGLKQLLASAHYLATPIFAFENIRFEKTAESRIRVTLSPSVAREQYMKSVQDKWKSSGGKAGLTFVFPGKVLSTTLPLTNANTATITLDATKPDELEPLLKIIGAKIEITAEAAGLQIKEPLDSRVLQRRAWNAADDEWADLPITDAGPGFVAEALGLTVSTMTLFPGAEVHVSKTQFSQIRTGTVVSVKLFAPRGRTLRTVSAARVLNAIDDKHRPIPLTDTTDEHDASGYNPSWSGSRDTSAAQLFLRLPVPPADAEAIERLTAEALATTIGNWKELSFTNVTENAQHDLSTLLPGATLFIKKASARNRQITIQADLKGPRAIRQLDLQCRIPGIKNLNSHVSEGQTTDTSRSVNIMVYSYGAEDDISLDNVTLTVRYPEEVRRERVQFTLRGLDIF
jgi:hypothetical protein